MLEIYVEWDFKKPVLINDEEITKIKEKIGERAASVSHILSKKYYLHESGYYILGKSYMRIRILTNRVGSVMKNLVNLRLGGAILLNFRAKEIQPRTEGFIIAPETFGELNYDTFISFIEDYYFNLADKIFNEEECEKKLIPVITPYEEKIYRVQLFGDEKMIELFNIIGLIDSENQRFLYHKRDLKELRKLAGKLYTQTQIQHTE
ncbi:MAG: hypothetical protein WHS64_09780 [Fervidobacterium sp.]|uniref:hypothetical protein n=1 Tax=Fervidobacterium TaxID=2422 RepID=UPI002209A27C|nr:hypothetical protein IB67_10195 [Fervidobacterium riparium]